MTHDDTQPIDEHQAHVAENLQHVRQTGRPIFITENGHPSGVLLSHQRYEELTEMAELADDVAGMTASLADIQAGRVTDAKDAMNKIAAKHGLTIDR